MVEGKVHFCTLNRTLCLLNGVQSRAEALVRLCDPKRVSPAASLASKMGPKRRAFWRFPAQQLKVWAISRFCVAPNMLKRSFGVGTWRMPGSQGECGPQCVSALCHTSLCTPNAKEGVLGGAGYFCSPKISGWEKNGGKGGQKASTKWGRALLTLLLFAMLL